jgi:YVTN family beta-propeller protein
MSRQKLWGLVVLVGVLALAAYSVASRPRASAPGRLYVSGEQSGVVTVIDTGTYAVIAKVEAGKRPRGVQVSPDGKRVYVALSGSPNMGPGLGQHEGVEADKSADAIGVIDAVQNKLWATLPAGSDPEQFVVSPDGKHLYVANEDTAQVTVVDTVVGSIARTIPVGTEPEGVAISRDGKTVYVTSETNNRIDIIDAVTNEHVGAIDVGLRPRSIALTPDGARGIATLEDAGSVALLDLTQRKALKTVKLPGDHVRPMGVVLSPDGTTAYVTTGRGKKLFALATDTLFERWSLEVGERPWGVAISPDGTKVYTANGPSDDVSVVDVETQRVVSRIAIGGRPWGVTLRP